MKEEPDQKAQERMRVILAHLGGQLTATDAALQLGISRKTFYEWLERARTGMLQALADRPGGRPGREADPEKEQLAAEVKTLEQERVILENRLRIQEAVRQTLEAMQDREPPSKKKQ